MNFLYFILFYFVFLGADISLADNDVDYSRNISASEVSEIFFGKAIPIEERRRMALNVGRVNINVRSSLRCGKLSLDGNISAELNRLKDQIGATATQLRNMLSSGQVVVAVICYYKPNVCAHIRHFSMILQEELNLQLDACKSLDNFINDQADKGRKILQVEAAKSCIDNLGPKIGPSQMQECLEKEGNSRNLLRPFNNELATRKQEVLKSILTVVRKSDDYDPLAQLLGEVELHKNGFWVQAFPKDMLTPQDYVTNVTSESQKTICNTSALRDLVRNNTQTQNYFAKYVFEIVKEKISEKTIDNLESIPESDRNMACRSLGLAIAGQAVSRFKASGQSALTSALANDALPEALGAFISNRSELTFNAITAKLGSQDIQPITKVLEKIHQLGLSYRKKNREVAADVSARKSINKESKRNDCTDSLSCSDD